MIFDDEVEKMRGPSLHGWVQRLTAEGLLNGAHYAMELLGALRAK